MKKLAQEERNLVINFIRQHPEEIVELFEQILERATKQNISDEEILITNYLNEIGMPRNLKGFNYSRYAILLCIDEPDYLNHITQKLYPAVAKEFNTTASRVEKDIRHSIEVVFERDNVEHIKKIFRTTISRKTGRPISSKFIALLADVVRMELNS